MPLPKRQEKQDDVSAAIKRQSSYDSLGPEVERKGVTEGEAQLPPISWCRLFCINIGYATVMLISGGSIPVFPLEAVKRQVPSSVVGMVYAMYTLAQVITSPFAAPLIRKFGPKRVHLCGLLISCSFTLIFGFLNRFAGYTMFVGSCLVVRYLQAVGASLVVTSAFTLATNSFPRRVGLVTSVLESVSASFLALGPALGGALYDLGGFSLPFFVLAAICFVAAIIVWTMVKDAPNPEDSQQGLGAKLKGYLSSWRGWLAMLILAVAITIWSSVPPHFQAYATEDLGLSPSEIGLYHTAGFATFSLTCPVFARLADRCGGRGRYLQVSLCLLGTGVSLLVFQPQLVVGLRPTWWSVLLGHCLKEVFLAGAYLPTFGLMMAACLQVGMPEDLGTQAFVSSLWYTVRCAGSAVTSPLSGIVIDSSDFATMIFTVSLAQVGLGISILGAIVVKGVVSRRCSESDVGKEIKDLT